MQKRHWKPCLTLVLSLAGVACPQPSPPAIQLGAAWYPEQWNEAAWDHDLTLMQQAHFTVVRVGEFAWSREEPSEGRYDLDWLARAVRLAEKHHIVVVLGTPTDAPPAWLTQKYPDTLGTDANGHLREHGGRRQFSYSSPRYRSFCVAIATQLARRFGHDPNVIGWQIGNEYTDESFDASTRKQFQAFLKDKFKTLDSLNEHWATAYWSQTYTDWSQIPLPTSGGNPGLLLEHKHFVTATWRSFQHDQIAAIRPLSDARQFITTNIGGLGWSDNWDHYKMTEDLDLASWDEYVGTGHLDVTKEAFMNDFVRGWKRKNFWVMETQPGTVNWASVNNSLDPGETRALAWQAIGHGADAILYWQWRDALNGQEQYHGAIVGPDGQPNPIYAEIQQLGEELQKTSAALANTSPQADVALLVDYDSRWAIDFQPHSKNYDQQQVLLDYYKVLSANGRTIDVISPDAPLDRYKLIVAPSLNVISKSLADHLLAYVKEGGQLVLGPRSGMKDEYDALNSHRQPGPLADALGAYVEQYYALDAPVKVASGSASIWAEQLTTTAATPSLTYGKANGWLDNKVASASRNIGDGKLAYIGALLEPETLQSALQPYLDDFGEPVEFFNDRPAGIEVSDRVGPDEQHIFIVINHNLNKPVDLKVRGQLANLLDANPSPQGVVHLAPQQVLVFTTRIDKNSRN
jgi:beta-galactosidase